MNRKKPGVAALFDLSFEISRDCIRSQEMLSERRGDGRHPPAPGQRRLTWLGWRLGVGGSFDARFGGVRCVLWTPYLSPLFENDIFNVTSF